MATTAENEGAKFWLQVVTELKNRGVKEIFIACVDGLKGFPEAIEAVFPKTQVQLCIVHMVRHSLNYVSWKQRKEVAEDLNDLPGANPGTSRGEPRRLFCQVGCKPSHHSQIMAQQLGADHPAIFLSARDTQGDLHD